MARKLDAMITAQEAKGMQHLLLTNIFVDLLLTGLALWAVYVFSGSFDFKKRSELYWLYVTLTVLVIFFASSFQDRFCFRALSSAQPGKRIRCIT